MRAKAYHNRFNKSEKLMKTGFVAKFTGIKKQTKR